MNKIDITIKVKNPEYGEALARGLCNESTNLNIFFEKMTETEINKAFKGVLLTDYDASGSPQIVHLSDAITRDEEETNISKLTPIRDILLEIERIAYESMGVRINTVRRKDTKIIHFNTLSGGSGVTTVSLIIARVLSLMDNRVIYLNFTSVDDYELYVEATFRELKNKRQYIFFKEKGYLNPIDDFVVKDKWGVYFFKPEKTVNSFFKEIDQDVVIKYLLEEEKFTHIVIDHGKNIKTKNDEREVLVTVNKENHNRVLSENCVETDLELINFGEEYYAVTDYSAITDDRDSFIETDGIVEISTSGSFFEDIENIVKLNEELFL